MRVQGERTWELDFRPTSGAFETLNAAAAHHGRVIGRGPLSERLVFMLDIPVQFESRFSEIEAKVKSDAMPRLIQSKLDQDWGHAFMRRIKTASEEELLDLAEELKAMAHAVQGTRAGIPAPGVLPHLRSAYDEWYLRATAFLDAPQRERLRALREGHTAFLGLVQRGSIQKFLSSALVENPLYDPARLEGRIGAAYRRFVHEAGESFVEPLEQQVLLLRQARSVRPPPARSGDSTQSVTNYGAVKNQVNVAGDATIHVPSHTPGAPRTAEKTRILFFAANPSDQGRLRLDQEHRRVCLALEGSTHRGQVDIQHWPEVHLRDLPSRLRRLGPSVVHFSGHGDPGGKLVLFDAQGKLKPMEAKAIARIVGRRADTIRLVVLNACHSGELAEALVEKIDIVVGTSDSIADDAAAQFAESFYEALWDGASVQDAFDDARDVVAAEVPGEEDIFNLYHREGVNPSEVKLTDLR